MDLGPVDRITTDAIGEPGARVFYIQARAGLELVTVIVEKQQVQLLAASVLELLEDDDGGLGGFLLIQALCERVLADAGRLIPAARAAASRQPLPP